MTGSTQAETTSGAETSSGGVSAATGVQADSGSVEESTGSTSGPSADETGSTSTGGQSGCVLEDSFEGPVPELIWNDITGAGPVSYSLGGEMSFAIPAGATDDYAGLLSDPIDVTGRAIRVRVLEPPAQDTPQQFFLGVRESSNGPRWDIMLDENFRPRLQNEDGTTGIVNVPYSVVEMPWIQTRFDGDEVVFEVSADGEVWQEMGRADNPLSLEAAQIALVGGTHNDNPTASMIRIDDVAVCSP